jgi:hypothetical protein
MQLLQLLLLPQLCRQILRMMQIRQVLSFTCGRIRLTAEDVRSFISEYASYLDIRMSGARHSF